jgi:putative transposase
VARASAYRAICAEALTPELLAPVRLALQQQRVLGTSRFQAMVEAKLHRFAGTRAAYRLRKVSGEKCP